MEKKNQHRGRNLLLLVLILAVCCVGYVVLRQTGGEEETEETEEEEAEALLSLADVVSLSYEREGEEIGLSYSEDAESWQRSGMEDFPVDSQTVSSMVSDLTGAKILRVISGDGSDLEEYGLENPACTVTLQDSGGESAVLYIGDENSLAGGTYVQLGGDDRILMTDEVLATTFNYGWVDLASVDEGPDIDDSEVNSLEVVQGEKAVSFVYDAEGRPEADATGSEKLFLMTEDGACAISSDWEEDILDAVQDFSYTFLAAYRPEEDERAAFGLDDPTAVITVQYTTTEEVESEDGDGEDESEEDDDEESEPETITEEHTYVLTVGAYEEETDCYYVQHDDSSSIFTMSASVLETLLDLDVTQMRPLNPAAVEADSIESFEVSLEGTTRTYAIERKAVTGTDGETEEEEEPETSYTLDGESIEESEYEAALEAVTDLDGVRLLMDGEALEADAEITIVFHRNVEAYPTVTIELIPYNENYYQLALNGGEPYMVVDIGNVERLKQTFVS